MTRCDHKRADDPRKTHPDGSWACVKCGRLRPPDPEPLRRLQAVEEAFIGEAMEIAQRHGWPLTGAWARAVRERLEMGEAEYGTRALERDNLEDILEETPDLGSWPVLELQRLVLQDAASLDGDRLDLLAIAAHGAAAHYYALRIKRRRAGLDD